MSKKKITFEEALDRLEEIIDKLESGEVTLDESLELYEDSVKLTKDCMEKLNNAEGKVTVLKSNLEKEFKEENFN